MGPTSYDLFAEVGLRHSDDLASNYDRATRLASPPAQRETASVTTGRAACLVTAAPGLVPGSGAETGSLTRSLAPLLRQ